MRSLLRTLASALSIALLLPALASALSPCGMADCPMVECGGSAGQVGHDCCPAADATLTAPCCERTVITATTAARLAEKPGAVSLAATENQQPRPSLAGAFPRPPACGPRRTLDCLSQSCVLRI